MEEFSGNWMDIRITDLKETWQQHGTRLIWLRIGYVSTL
jgi:hypothetical protein